MMKTVSSSDGGLFSTDSLEHALDIIRDYEKSTLSKFSVAYSKRKGFGRLPYDPSYSNIPHSVCWVEREDTNLQFRVTPFLALNHMGMECIHGPERHTNFKEKVAQIYAEKRKTSLTPIQKRRVQSKKKNCPAVIQLKEVVYFPEYSIPQNTKSRRSRMSKKLREDLKNKKQVKQEQQIIVCLPSPANHSNHPIREGKNLDVRLKDKIAELVKRQVTEVNKIQSHLVQYLKTDIFHDCPLPNRKNRQFFPTRATIEKQVALMLKSPDNDRKQVTGILNDHAYENPQTIVYFYDSAELCCESDEHEGALLIENDRLKETPAVVGAETHLLESHEFEHELNESGQSETEEIQDVLNCTLATHCRGQLDVIRNKTFELNNAKLLEELSVKLSNVICWLEEGSRYNPCHLNTATGYKNSCELVKDTKERGRCKKRQKCALDIAEHNRPVVQGKKKVCITKENKKETIIFEGIHNIHE